MPDKYIDTRKKLVRNVRYWKARSFRKDYIPLEKAVATISTPDRIVEARQDFPGRWVLCPVDSKGTQPAVFWTPCVWRFHSDLQTGNYVPPGEIAPDGLLESRIKAVPSSMCQFSYGLDSYHDKTLYDAQEAFETYIRDVPGFNQYKKPRRTWQDGSDPNASAYVMSSRMFFKRTKYTAKKEQSVSYKLHSWIEEAAKTTQYFPNPDRPKFLECRNGELADIADCDPAYIRAGDLVWISFFVEWMIGINHWSTTCTPYEIIRVATVSPDLVGDGKGADVEPEAPRSGLVAGQVMIFEEFSTDSDNDIDTDVDTEMRVDGQGGATSGTICPATVLDDVTDISVLGVEGSSNDTGEHSDSKQTQSSPEVFFGPDDVKNYWDTPVNTQRSPTPSTPPEWPTSPARPEDDIDSYMQFLDTEAEERNDEQCDSPHASPTTTFSSTTTLPSSPFPEATVSLPMSPALASSSFDLYDASTGDVAMMTVADSPTPRGKKRVAEDGQVPAFAKISSPPSKKRAVGSNRKATVNAEPASGRVTRSRGTKGGSQL